MYLSYFNTPLHPAGRPESETLADDRDAIVLADRLGYREAFVGERLSDTGNVISSAVIFLASLLPLTERIVLASSTTVPLMHPALTAVHAAMLDNMAKGRFVLGIAPGNDADAELLETLKEDHTALFFEAIDLILAGWASEPPYGLKTPHWTITTERTLYPATGLGYLHRPYRDRLPEIVVTLGAAFAALAEGSGARGFHLLSADTLPATALAAQRQSHAKGCAAAGKPANPRDWRVARTIFVADDAATARRYGKDGSDSPYRAYHLRAAARLARAGHRDGAVDADRLVDAQVIAGTPDEVVEAIAALRAQAGPFGTLVYTGVDWADPSLARRSMTLMAEQVMPRLDAALARYAAA
ncbi:MAG: LLM class flavin-dependent oxidoreductase [Alphaproteobacteria bacterium]|nr:LLM class flavin-dependent oxidoreductase [Alphaproteobacteria bacterium]